MNKYTLKKHSYAIYRSGYITSCKNPNENDKVVGYRLNGMTVYLEGSRCSFKTFSVSEAYEMIITNGWDEPAAGVPLKICECGADKTNIPQHSRWCPKGS